MEQAFWSFIFGLVSAILGSVVGRIIGEMKVRKQRKKQSGIDEELRFKNIERALMLLMRSDLIRLHNLYKDKGVCPISVKYSIKEEYEGYHALGGNGVATKMVEEIMALPEKEGEK